MTSLQKKSVALIFVLSGATGLVYETLWIRILSLGVGSTSQSMSVVLSIFFLGLSLGSFLSGKRASLVQRPLMVYGAIEMFLALMALVLIYPLLKLHSVMGLLPLVGSFSWLGMLLKFLIVAVLLLAPTVCMGATLPLLVRVFSEREPNGKDQISRLYALNTLGAVIGAFITGYWLIPQFGVVGSNLLAVGVNLSLGFLAFTMGKKLEVAGVTQNSGATPSLRTNPQIYWVLFTTFICGFVSIAFEVLWNKYLNIFFGTNLYGIGLVLALFLFGIALGSYLLSFLIPRLKSPKAVFPKLLMALFLLTLVALFGSTLLLNEAPRLSIFAFYFVHSFMSLVTVKTVIVALILIVPTSLFGALFPLCVHILGGEKGDRARIVGLAYSINTLGAILGSYVAGMILIPKLGSSNTVHLLMSFMAGTALWVIFKTVERRSFQAVFCGVASVIAVSTFYFGELDFRNLIKSAYHQKAEKISTVSSKVDWLHALLKPFESNYEEFKAIYEGETAIITLSHDPSDGEDYRNYLRLKTSGLNESIYNLHNLEELPKYEALVGFLPYLFSRAPREAFVVGYGGGYTVDFLTSTDIKKVNVVELEEGILKAADYVYKGNNPITSRPNLNLQIEDARFVLTTKQLPLQDIIVSQPSHSWLPGASNLFTREFFEIVKGNLSDKGIFSQWLNLYNMDVAVLKSILKTFFSVFPEGAVFTQLEDQELVLLGSKQPLQLNLQKMELIQKNPLFKKKLAQVFGQSSYELLSLFSVSRQDALRLTEDAKLNTDQNAYAEVRQSRIFYEGLKGGQTPQQYLSSVFNGDFSPIIKGGDSPQFYYNLLVSLSEGSQYDKFYAILHRFEQKVKDVPDQFWNLGYLALKAQRYQSAYQYLSKTLKKQPSTQVLNLLFNSLAEMERYSEIIALRKQYSHLKDKVSDCFLLGALNEVGKHEEAKALEQVVSKNIPGYTNACGAYVNKILGAHYLIDGRPEIAIRFLEAYYAQWSSDVPNLERMILAYQRMSDTGNEKQFREYLPRVIESERKRLQILVDYYRNSGHADDAEILAARAARLSRPIDSVAE